MKYNLISKPKKFNLLYQKYLNIIKNSDFYTSSSENPLIKGITLKELNYRCSSKQKEQWIDKIINNDSRIVKIKEKKGFLILVYKSQLSKLPSFHYIIFANTENEKDSNVITKTKTKKNGIYNVQNKSRLKKRGRKKINRK